MRKTNACPVAALASEVRRLEDECAAADELRDTEKSTRIFDQIKSMRLAATYLIPTSASGAAYQVELSAILADSMVDARRPERFATMQAIERLAGAVGALLAATA